MEWVDDEGYDIGQVKSQSIRQSVTVDMSDPGSHNKNETKNSSQMFDNCGNKDISFTKDDT